MFSITKFEHSNESDLGTSKKQAIYDVVYVQDGCADVCIAGETNKIQKGQLAIGDTTRQLIFKCSSEAKLQGFLVRFDRSFLEDVMSGMSEGIHILRDLSAYNCVIEPDRPTQKHIESLLERMFEESTGDGLYKVMLCRLLLAEFLIVLTRVPRNTDNKMFSITMVEHTVYEIAEYITKNYAEDISLSTLADMYYVNSSYLARIFKRFTSYTVVEYINKVRVASASKLLREGNMRIIDVADTTGFGSLTHFNRIFKRIMGVSPMRYRSAHNETLSAARIVKKNNLKDGSSAMENIQMNGKENTVQQNIEGDERK